MKGTYLKNNRDKAASIGAVGGKRSRKGFKFIQEEAGYYIYLDKRNKLVKFKKG